jgi:hypothetical protein
VTGIKVQADHGTHRTAQPEQGFRVPHEHRAEVLERELLDAMLLGLRHECLPIRDRHLVPLVVEAVLERGRPADGVGDPFGIRSRGLAGVRPLIITIFLTPNSPASWIVRSVSALCFSPSSPGSSGLPDTFSAAISSPRLSIADSAVLRLLASASSSAARRCGAGDQPPPVISTPATPSSATLSSIASKERPPRQSLQMESFMPRLFVFARRLAYSYLTQTAPWSAERTQVSIQRTPSSRLLKKSAIWARLR